jgi:hypothetical protein
MTNIESLRDLSTILIDLLPTDKIYFNFLSSIQTRDSSLPFEIVFKNKSNRVDRFGPHLETQIKYDLSREKKPESDFGSILDNCPVSPRSLNNYQLFHLFLIADNFDWNTNKEDPCKALLFELLADQTRIEFLEFITSISTDLNWNLDSRFTDENLSINSYNDMFRSIGNCFGSCEISSMYNYLFKYKNTASNEENLKRIESFSKLPHYILTRLLYLNQFQEYIESNTLGTLIDLDNRHFNFCMAYLLTNNFHWKTNEEGSFFTDNLSKYITPSNCDEITKYIFLNYYAFTPKGSTQLDLINLLKKIYSNQVRRETFFEEMKELTPNLKDLILYTRIFEEIKPQLDEINIQYFYNNLVPLYSEKLLNASNELKTGISHDSKFSVFFNDPRQTSAQILHANILIGQLVCDEKSFNKFLSNLKSTIYTIKPLFFGSFTSVDLAKKYVSHILLVLLSQINIDDSNFSNNSLVQNRINTIYNFLETNIIFQYITNIRTKIVSKVEFQKASIIDDETFVIYLSHLDNQSQLMKKHFKNWEKIYPIDWKFPA